MRWKLWKGKWDEWFKDEDNQLTQWFRGVDDYLSNIFRRRISLRDNLFCSFIEQENVTPNINITLENVLTNLNVEGAVILQSTEPVQLTWSASALDFTYKLTSASSSVAKVKIAIFYQED